MARFRSSLVANVAGAGWTAVLQIICVPIFLKLMGAEGYGLIGFYVALQMSLQVLDLGISVTMNRELARYSAQSDSKANVRNCVRTLELLYWLIGLGIAACLLVAAPSVGTHWIKANSLQSADVTQLVRLMALTMVFQWPLSFYQNGLNGLHQQVHANFVRIVAAGLSYGGAVFVLVRVSSSVTAFFMWQLVASIIHIVLIASAFWNSMPRSTQRPRFDLSQTRGIWSFAGGMSAIAVLSTILTQMDKVVLSTVLSLEDFGYYILGGVIASSLQLFISPIFAAVFPRLSSMFAKNDVREIRDLYHLGTQLMAVLVLPMAVVLGMFAPQVINLWTGDSGVANRVAPIATLLVIGTAINGLMHLPYALQLSHGWTTLSLRFALVKVIIFLPLLCWAAARYGAVGGAATWAALNACYMLIGVPLTHRRLLRRDALRWIFRDVVFPLLGVLVVVAVYRACLGNDATGWRAGVEILGASVIAVLAAVLAAPEIRHEILKNWFAYRAVGA